MQLSSCINLISRVNSQLLQAKWALSWRWEPHGPGTMPPSLSPRAAHWCAQWRPDELHLLTLGSGPSASVPSPEQTAKPFTFFLFKAKVPQNQIWYMILVPGVLFGGWSLVWDHSNLFVSAQPAAQWPHLAADRFLNRWCLNKSWICCGC